MLPKKKNYKKFDLVTTILEGLKVLSPFHPYAIVKFIFYF